MYRSDVRSAGVRVALGPTERDGVSSVGIVDHDEELVGLGLDASCCSGGLTYVV